MGGKPIYTYSQVYFTQRFCSRVGAVEDLNVVESAEGGLLQVHVHQQYLDSAAPAHVQSPETFRQVVIALSI